MRITQSETLLTGHWLLRDGQVVADETCRRINDLIRTHLRVICRDSTGWKVLYRDPNDLRLWELAYPQSELHGGGPPQLRYLSNDEAKEKYGVAALQ